MLVPLEHPKRSDGGNSGQMEEAGYGPAAKL